MSAPTEATSSSSLLRRYSLWGVGCVFGFPALGGALFGYDIGATSYVITQLMDEKRSGVSWSGAVKNSSILQGVITSGGVAGAFVGALIVFRVADAVGRRKEMVLGSYLYLVGGSLEMISGGVGQGTTIGVGLAALLLGRFAYGVGCGFVMHGAPSYIAEMAPPSIRGTLVSLKEAAIVVGIAVGYGVGYGLSRTKHGWQLAYGLSLPLSLILWAGCTLVLPPSARWLALRGEPVKAQRSLRFVYSDERAIQAAAAELNDALSDETTPDEESTVGSTVGSLPGLDDDTADPSLWEPRYRRPLVAGLGVVLLQQFTGQPSVLYYASSIFDEAGIGAIATVFVGLFKLVATLGAVVTVDRRGRRRLLFEGTAVILVSLVGLAVAFATLSSSNAAGQGLVVALVFLYISGYQFGFGPCAWLLISEIFPLKVRGQAVALAVQANFAANLFVSLLFPVALGLLRSLAGTKAALAALFGLFAVLAAYSLTFIHRFVPETKGLTLEQIEQYWSSSSSSSSSSSEGGGAKKDETTTVLDDARIDPAPLLSSSSG